MFIEENRKNPGRIQGGYPPPSAGYPSGERLVGDPLGRLPLWGEAYGRFAGGAPVGQLPLWGKARGGLPSRNRAR